MAVWNTLGICIVTTRKSIGGLSSKYLSIWSLRSSPKTVYGLRRCSTGCGLALSSASTMVYIAMSRDVHWPPTPNCAPAQ